MAELPFAYKIDPDRSQTIPFFAKRKSKHSASVRYDFGDRWMRCSGCIWIFLQLGWFPFQRFINVVSLIIHCSPAHPFIILCNRNIHCEREPFNWNQIYLCAYWKPIMICLNAVTWTLRDPAVIRKKCRRYENLDGDSSWCSSMCLQETPQITANYSVPTVQSISINLIRNLG